ncbi:hypothetical protein ACFPRL_16665 [Pseudoclavibacter helvolus]
MGGCAGRVGCLPAVRWAHRCGARRAEGAPRRHLRPRPGLPATQCLAPREQELRAMPCVQPSAPRRCPRR